MKDPWWAVEISVYASEHPTAVEALRLLCADDTVEDAPRFAAFYTLGAMLRRREDHREHRELMTGMRRHPEWFGAIADHPLFTIAWTHSELTSEAPDSRSAALAAAQQWYDRDRDNFAAQEYLALRLLDCDPDRDEDPEVATRALKLVTAAIRACEESARQSKTPPREPYARFHITKAQAHRALKQFADAHQEVRTAIEREPSSGNEYVLRIGKYQLLDQQISVEELVAPLAEEVQASREARARTQAEMRRSKFETLQLMGLLAAVIAFIATAAGTTASSNVASTHDFVLVARLQIVMAGVIVTVFAAFAALHDDPRDTTGPGAQQARTRGRRRLLIGAFGLALMIAPLASTIVRSIGH